MPAQRRYAVVMFALDPADTDTDTDLVDAFVSAVSPFAPTTWTYEGCDVVENAGQWSLLRPGFD